MSLKDCAKVMGRVQFADAQVMGREGKLVMAEIRAWSRGACGDLVLNESCRKAYFEAGEPRMLQALCAFETKECLGRTWPWFSRVPSDSNIADSPSRLDFQHLLELGFVRDSCLCPFTSVDVKNLGAR